MGRAQDSARLLHNGSDYFARIPNSAIDMKDLADLAEYHRFLDRFQHEEEGDHRRELLYGGANFGTEGQVDPEE
jgi:hypothetical protein